MKGSGEKMKEGMAGDWTANLNFDFLIGLTVFILAFIYVIYAVPGIFLPYQTNSVDLSSVAYRTSCILAEDPGWYVNVSLDSNISYINWEDDANRVNVTRVGLAVDKRMPNVLSIKKIQALQDIPYNVSRDKMGLNGTMIYNYSLAIDTVTSSGSVVYKTEIFNKSSNDTSDSVELLERVVLIREGEGLFIDDDDPANIDAATGSLGNEINLNATPRFEGDVSVRVVHPAISNPNINVKYYLGNTTASLNFNAQYAYLDGNGKIAHDYYIYKNNSYVEDEDRSTLSLTDSDILDIVVDTDTIKKNHAIPKDLTLIKIEGLNILAYHSAPYPVEEYSINNTRYRYYNSMGLMTLKVWRS